MAVSMLTFEALAAIPGLRHGFIPLIPGVDVDTTDRDLALARLAAPHGEVLTQLGYGTDELALAEQVHGAEVAVLGEGAAPGKTCLGVDGMIAAPGDHCMGIYVADCCAVYLVDPVTRACGLVHSGRKGSEAGIAVRAIQLMTERFGSRPKDLIAQLSPCIRPPHYEVDFAAIIRENLAVAGVPRKSIHDCGICTATERDAYYSYRMERGATGRMLALLGWPEE